MGNLPCRSDKPCLDPESGLPIAKDIGGILLPARCPGMPGSVDSHLCAAAQASSRASPGEDHRGQLAARVDLCTIMAKERGGLKAKEAWGGES